MKKRLHAIISAASLEVGCPHCGDPQPNPNGGSHLWLPSEVIASQGSRICNACDEPFHLSAQNKVSVVAQDGAS